jgi:hypothetical protein
MMAFKRLLGGDLLVSRIVLSNGLHWASGVRVRFWRITRVTVLIHILSTYRQRSLGDSCSLYPLRFSEDLI